MEDKIKNPLLDAALAPANYAALMLECTDGEGRLRIPAVNFTDGLEEVEEAAVRIFEMDWDAGKREALVEDFEVLYGNIREIAGICHGADCDPLHDAQMPALEESGLTDVWKKYIRGYEFRGLGPEAVRAIEKSMLVELGEGELTAEEKRLCDQYYDAYNKAIEEEAAQRLGGGILDAAVISRARRLCKLLLLCAPRVVTDNEAQRLIEALVLTRFAKREICE